MTNETGTGTPEPTTPSGPTPGEAWGAVLTRMSDFGVAVTVWAGAAANEPDTKEKLDQVRAGIDEIVVKVDTVVSRVARSQAGQTIGDAAHTMAVAAAPHVRDLFSELSDIFGNAASRVDKAAKDATAVSAPPAEAPPAPPAVPNAEEPVVPER